MNDTAFWTEYEPATGWCRCSCTWSRRERDTTKADELLAAHTLAHELLTRAGVA